MKTNTLLLGLLAVGGLLLFSACTTDCSATDDSSTATNSSAESAPNETASTTTEFHNDGQYYHLRGTLANLQITMDLFEYQSYDSGARSFRGFYRYDRYGGPIALYGYLDDNGQLILTEQSSWEEESHALQGLWSPTAGYSGQWESGDRKKVHDFNLQPSLEGIVQLRTAAYQDSLLAFPSWPNSPKMTYEAEWLSPLKTQLSASQQQFLEKVIAQGLFNLPKNTNNNSLQQALQADFQNLSTDFQEEMQLMRKDDMLDSLASPGESYLNYSYSSSMQVYYNQLPLLTVGYTDYSYLGGAHGMYATQVASYELTSMRQLKLDDILKPGYEERVSQVLADAIRTKYQLEDADPLSSILFESKIAPNENFGITNKGIFFVYTPYEIAPYVVGEIELFVSFDKIREFVRKEWLSSL